MRVMRVLTRANVGGPAVQAWALWHAMADAGVQTLLVVGGCEDEPELPLPDIPHLPLERAVQHGVGAAGVVRVPDMVRRAAPLRDRRAVAQLTTLMRAFAPDVVHTHMSKAGWLVPRALGSVHHRPQRIHTYHGHVLRDYFPAPIEGWLRRGERRLARARDQLVAVSASCREELLALGVGRGMPFHVVPPAVPDRGAREGDRERARRELGIVGFTALFAGRLVPIKDPLAFVRALAAWPEGRGVVWGDGPLRDAVARAAPANVDVGPVRPNLPRWLAAFDAVVLPSVREGLPLVAVEAARAGVPVVGYDVPGVRDALERGAGVLVPRGSGPEGLARALRELAGDPERRAALVEQARIRAARFDPAAVARILLARYRGALP